MQPDYLPQKLALRIEDIIGLVFDRGRVATGYG